MSAALPFTTAFLATLPMPSALRSPVALLQEAAANAAPAQDAVQESWRFLEMPAAWIVVLILLPGAFGVAAFAYWREALSKPMRWTLISLRFLSLLLLLAVLFRPVHVRQEQSVQPPETLLLFDDSASMARADGYIGDDEARAAVQALTSQSADSATRSEIAASVREPITELAESRGYVARSFRFADDLAPLAEGRSLEGRGAASALGDALRSALASHRGRHVTDVVMVTDGRNNNGASLEEAAGAAKVAGVKVHTVLVGDNRTEVNVAVELVDAPESVLDGDQIEIAARVSARGVDSGSVTLLLEELSTSGRGDVRVESSVEVPLVEAGDRVVLVAGRDPLDYGASERRFRLRVDPVEGERVEDDNSVVFSVTINREKVRVLYVEGYPRYEYRFLNAELRRIDDRIDVQMYLLSATPDFQQDRTRGLSPLDEVPTSREALLENYDVIILGDINPYDVSPDPSRGEEFVASLFEFVERGGGLCVIAGQYDMPRSVSGTEFEKLLPVDLEPSGLALLEVPTETEHRYTLENPAIPHEIVRLEEDAETNRALWEDERGLKGFYWHYPVQGAKPGSQVLLRHPVASLGGGGERDPLLVTGYYPSGRTLFLAIEATNRWRFRYGYRYYESFWRNSLRWLSLGRMRSGDRRYELEALRTEYDISERVTFEARVLDEDFRPSGATEQEIVVRAPDGSDVPLVLPAVAGRKGQFRGTFQPERPGRYAVRIESETGETRVRSEFEVLIPSREYADPSPDPLAMQRLAELTGGQAVTAVDWKRLEQAFPTGMERREPVSSQLEDAWDRWGTLIAALLVLSAEWILRKKAELV